MPQIISTLTTLKIIVFLPVVGPYKPGQDWSDIVDKLWHMHVSKALRLHLHLPIHPCVKS